MLRNGRLFKRQIDSIPKVLNSSSATGKKKKQLDIYSLIPPRINRTPTDILKALSYTVGRDPTAFHYQIPDDPFMYPLSNFQKKKRILAMDSGRKSARWIVENNPGFFNHDLAEPTIKAFLNKPVFDENSEVTEETLLSLIQGRSVSQAIAVYNLLRSKGLDVSKDVRQSLLELVCFYNSNEGGENSIWDKWYEMDTKKKNVWKNDGFVMELFDSLESECPIAYAALIQGMLKHNNVEEAVELFASGKKKKIKFPASVYNLMLETIPLIKKNPLKAFEAVEGYLTEMAKESIKPNLGTLNSILRTVSNFNEISVLEKEPFLCKLLVEFINLKIYPSLGSYYYLLNILVDPREDSQFARKVAYSIMESVSGRRWTIQHPSDLSFFPYAMFLFSTSLRSLKLSESLMKTYLKDDHYKFLNTHLAEMQFFDQYLFLNFLHAPVQQSMKIYRDLVPSQTFVGPRTYGTIIRVLIQKKNYKYLEEIWEDMRQYLCNIYPKITGNLSLIISPVSSLKKEETPKFFYDVAELLFRLTNTTNLEPNVLQNMLITFIRFEDEEKVSSLMEFIIGSGALYIELGPLKESFAFAMSKKNIPLIKNCLELSYKENNPDLKAMGEEALPLLNEKDRSWLNAILKKAKKEEDRLSRNQEEQEVNPKEE